MPFTATTEKSLLLLMLRLLLLLLLRLTAACTSFHRLRLSAAAVDAYRVLAHVPGVHSWTSCAQLCLRETPCAAIVLQAPLCRLLTASLRALDLPANHSGPVEVWAAHDRSFGRCPPTYRRGWRHLFFRLDANLATWSQAQLRCRSDGARLIEISSPAKAQVVVDMYGEAGRRLKAWVGAAQRQPRDEPRGGWRWHTSDSPVSPALWAAPEPNNWSGFEDTAQAIIAENSPLKLNDASENAKIPFICECLALD